jgi:hypothetical protein
VCRRVCTGGVHELLPGKMGISSRRVSLSPQFPRHQEVCTEVRCLSARKSRFLEREPGLCVFQLDPLLTPARAQEEGHPEGPKKTAEGAFAKLLGIQHGAGGLSISVSNRQQPMVSHFGTHLDDWVSNHLSIARASSMVTRETLSRNCKCRSMSSRRLRAFDDLALKTDDAGRAVGIIRFAIAA